MTMQEYTLKDRQALPLDVKIYFSKKKIEEFFELMGGKVYLSVSGADSVVLDFICKQTKYNSQIERISVAGAEPPENIKYLLAHNVRTLPMQANKKQIIKDWGYPVISKAQAVNISRYHRTKDPAQKEKRLNGYIGKNGILITDGKINNKYRMLVHAPFEISEKCCDKFKKKPLKTYEKIEGKYPITGERAEESRLRKAYYLKHGCNLTTGNRPKSTPMGFWTKQDVLQCIKEYNLEVPTIYGEVIEGEDGLLKFSGEQRTGCDVCGFGLLGELDRLKRLKARNIKMYNYMMNGGEWVEKEITRPMAIHPGADLVESNLYWVPNEEGFGYRFVLEYIFELLGIDYEL